MNLPYKRFQHVTININLFFYRDVPQESNDIALPFNAQIGVGLGGGNLGFGYGFTGDPDGLVRGPFQPFGMGFRFRILKPWRILSVKNVLDISKIYMGIEGKLTFL